jgi:hypothetical protein
MEATASMIDKLEYRLALVLPKSRRLLAIDQHGEPRLPRIPISRWTRPAEQLTQIVTQKWNVESVVIDFLKADSMTVPCAVVEVRSRDWDFQREGFLLIAADEVHESDLAEEERMSVESMLSSGAGGSGPFSHFGWMQEAQEWIRSAVHDHEVEFTCDIRQLNASGTFALVRFGTKRGPAYWLKAVGEPDTHEFWVTTTLAKLHPSYLPVILAERTDWHAWVMEEFGYSLHASFVLDEFERATTRLADLQKSLVGKPERLLSLGCADQRLRVLESHLTEIVDYLDFAMGNQTATHVDRLSTLRLYELKDILQIAIASLEDVGIPESIMHNDISPGSILSNGRTCVFTDWCEAYVGNPFLTFEQLCVHVARNNPYSAMWLERLREVYKASWLDMVTESQIDQALTLAPPIAILSYLYGRGGWLNSPRRQDPVLQRYSRSLARHLDRAVRAPALVEALC